MNKKRLLVLALLLIVVVNLFTGCRVDELSEDEVTWEYDKRIEAVVVYNKFDGDISVDCNVVLLDKDKEILYKETFEDEEILKDENLSVNLEDVKPDYISYDKIDSMEVEILNVYEYSVLLTSIFIILIVAFLLFVLVMFIIAAFG